VWSFSLSPVVVAAFNHHFWLLLPLRCYCRRRRRRSTPDLSSGPEKLLGRYSVHLTRTDPFRESNQPTLSLSIPRASKNNPKPLFHIDPHPLLSLLA
jgi:hypothetical protein